MKGFEGGSVSVTAVLVVLNLFQLTDLLPLSSGKSAAVHAQCVTKMPDVIHICCEEHAK
jgi:hypothetical protein